MKINVSQLLIVAALVFLGYYFYTRNKEELDKIAANLKPVDDTMDKTGETTGSRYGTWGSGTLGGGGYVLPSISPILNPVPITSPVEIHIASDPGLAVQNNTAQEPLKVLSPVEEIFKNSDTVNSTEGLGTLGNTVISADPTLDKIISADKVGVATVTNTLANSNFKSVNT